MTRIRYAALFAAALAVIPCGKDHVARAPQPHTLPKAGVMAKTAAKAKPEPEKSPAPAQKTETVQKAEVPPARPAPAKKAGPESCDTRPPDGKGDYFGDFAAAVYENDFKDVKSMLRKRLVTLEGWCGMDMLSAAKSPRMLRLLIRNGADVNSVNSDGETALMMAAFNGQYQKVRDLIKAGADAKIKNTKADTSAISYCTSGKIARLLIENGADVNEKNIYGTTPLIYAATRGCNEVAKVLIRNGADVNVNSPLVGTALMYASRFGNAELVKLLLSNGVDVNAVGNDYFYFNKKAKKTALQLAKENKNEDVVKLLEQHGARR